MVRRRGDDPRSDRTLIATCNEGDAVEAAQAFDVLYRRHKDFVLRVAKRFLPDTDSALDVLQETFLYLLRRFPPTGTGIDLTAKLTTLLYPIAKNMALTALRRTRRFRLPRWYRTSCPRRPRPMKRHRPIWVRSSRPCRSASGKSSCCVSSMT